MRKYTFAFISSALVILQGAWTFIAPPDQITWMRWRVGAFVVAILALAALAMQLYRQAKQEQTERDEQEKRERKRDRKIDELLRRVPKRYWTQDSDIDSGGTLGLIVRRQDLVDRVKNLAHEYYDCLQRGMQLTTYESRLKPKLLELLPELQEAPIKTTISQDDIEPDPNHLTDAVRNTADKLALTAMRLEYPKTKSAGEFLVLDEDDNSDDTE